MKISTTIVLAAAAASSSAAAVDMHKRIIGGSDASYKFSANIVKVTASGVGVCSAAFLSDQVLVTTASCVSDTSSDSAYAASALYVGQGSASDALATAGAKGANVSKLTGYVNPAQVLTHPGFNSRAYADNIALVMLGAPYKNATAVKVQKKLPGKGAYLTAAGYGAADGGATALQKAQVVVGENATCSQAFASYKDSSNLVCVGPVKNKGGACNGDGLLLQEDSSNVALIGVLDLFASTDSQDNAQCSDKNVYNFYTAVENYMAWITQKTPLKESALLSTATISTSGSGSASDNEDSKEQSSKGGASSKGRGGRDQRS
ncbi:trypsin-like serine protease [Linderina pennispora]|uniref:Trypsin-like serine protease n=1 Tax=Linderina pennispora TaxID=61395 RepID=A0A1Y1VX58_9FUNG|nr:trypsin-like serine protease [Linderina pennispora]ORX65897.1 trypsin-like serine protease [Linderina pennispora]